MPTASLADSRQPRIAGRNQPGIVLAMANDLDGIRHALTVARERGYAEVELEDGDLKFKAVLGSAPKRQPSSAVVALPATPEEAEAAEPGLEEIRSPLVGFFKPTEPLVAGAAVEQGEVVGVVASLGDIPYSVESPVSGEIVEVLVGPDEAVEYGQVIAKVRS